MQSLFYWIYIYITFPFLYLVFISLLIFMRSGIHYLPKLFNSSAKSLVSQLAWTWFYASWHRPNEQPCPLTFKSHFPCALSGESGLKICPGEFRVCSRRFLPLKCPFLALESGAKVLTSLTDMFTCALHMRGPEPQPLTSSPLPHPPPPALIITPVAPPFCPARVVAI